MMVRGHGFVAASVAVAFCLSGFGCSRSSLLLLDGETSADASGAAGKSAGGGRPTGVGGAAFGGTFSQGGTFGSVGFPGGGFQSGGVQSGGQSGGPTTDTCPLSVGDCAVASDLGCDRTRKPCEGVLLSHQEFASSAVQVVDVAASPSGHVAVAGSFRGTLNLGGKSQPLSSVDATGTVHTYAFVASFDASGQAEWAYAQVSDYDGTATGVRFTPSGYVVTQGTDGTGAFVIRHDAQGVLRFSTRSVGDVAAPGRVGVDNDGYVLLSGTYSGTLTFAGAVLAHTGLAGYLIKLDEVGNANWALSFLPTGWQSVHATNVAVDDEDNVAVIGTGQDADGNAGAFLQKFWSTGALRFSNELHATQSLQIDALTTDRKMRLLVAGEFTGTLTNAGSSFDNPSTHSDVWVAQYSGDGKLSWQHTYPTEGKGAHVAATAVDPYANVVLAGHAAALTVDGLKPLASPSLFLLKLRPDAEPVWLRSFEGAGTTAAALASDPQSNLWLGGTFDGKVRLDTDTLDGAGAFHGMLLKLGP